MRLHMLRLDPDPLLVARWAGGQGLIRPGADDGYIWHALLKAAFGEAAPKPFRLVEREGRAGYLVGYGRFDRAELMRLAQSFADPAVAQAIGLSGLAVKPMPEAFEPGRRLGFEVRVRPVVRTTRNDTRGRPGREIDAFLAASETADARPDRLAVYREWLARACGGSLRLDEVRAVSLRRARLARRGAPDEAGRRALTVEGRQGGGPDVILAGELTVADAEGFLALLARGVGRHRAFGFGMLLLSPPGREAG
jgi:CRISPR system Cascade subunit CasE